MVDQALPGFLPGVPTVVKDAIVSADGLYRYWLLRRWNNGPTMCFVMLNPSTADATKDDPTIRRCAAFAKREGCGSIQVVNLFAFRCTDPKDLWVAPQPEGPDNLAFVQEIMAGADVVVMAWGAIHRRYQQLSSVWAHIAQVQDGRFWCLGTTASGAPCHPLFVPGTTPLQPWTAGQL